LSPYRGVSRGGFMGTDALKIKLAKKLLEFNFFIRRLAYVLDPEQTQSVFSFYFDPEKDKVRFVHKALNDSVYDNFGIHWADWVEIIAEMQSRRDNKIV